MHVLTATRGAIWLSAALLIAAAPASAQERRFEVLFADGTRASSEGIGNWLGAGAEPVVQGRRLFDPSRPALALIDATNTVAATPPAYVELIGGDRLPGEVARYGDGMETRFDQRQPHLVVRSAIPLHNPSREFASPVRVGTRWLRRVVWQAGANQEYQPGTVLLRDQRRIRFRSLRWGAEHVTLLLDDGIETFPFFDIAELHLPRQDGWEAWFDQLAVLTPATDSRLIQVETSDGLRAVTSRARFEGQYQGDKNKTENWLDRIQPAWSLDPLWVRFPSIRTHRFFAPHEPLLTLVDPVEVRQKSTFGGGWHWRRDRSVAGLPLRCTQDECPWGFGVHAFNELEFPLPAIARGFQTRVGLDHSVGEGGCVRARVWLTSAATKPLFESPLLVGAKTIVDTGPLPIPPETRAGTRLVLTLDPVLGNRPAGADPFDIRDSANWLRPTLRLDESLLRAEVAARAARQIPALAGWSITPAGGPFDDAQNITTDDTSPPQITGFWDERDPRGFRYQPLLGTSSKFLVLAGEVSRRPDDRWLALCASRVNGAAESNLLVLVDGRAIGQYSVPSRSSAAEPDPILVPLPDAARDRVRIEIVQVPLGKDATVDWRGVTTVSHHPGLLRLFEDSLAVEQVLPFGDGEAQVVDEEPCSGDTCLKVLPPDRGNPNWPGLAAIIRDDPHLGEFRYLRLACRKREGKLVAVELAHDGQYGGGFRARRMNVGDGAPGSLTPPLERVDVGQKYGYRYFFGNGPSPLDIGHRVTRSVPRKWERTTRDLYNDLGEFTLTGLAFVNPDEEPAWFDQIYLARNTSDLQRLDEELRRAADPPKPLEDETIEARATEEADFPEILAPVALQFAVIQHGDDLRRLKMFRGRQHVLRTVPPASDKPAILRTLLHVERGKRTFLEADVSQQEQGDWQFLVLVNGTQIADHVINQDSAPDGWALLSVDLSAHAGQDILLEVRHHPHNRKPAPAFWQRLKIVTR